MYTGPYHELELKGEKYINRYCSDESSSEKRDNPDPFVEGIVP